MCRPSFVIGQHLTHGRSHGKGDAKDGHAGLTLPFVSRHDVHESDLDLEQIGHFRFDVRTSGVVRSQLDTNPTPLWTMGLGRSGHEA